MHRFHFRLGDVVVQRDERGVVVHMDPPFMRLYQLGCYVLLDETARVLARDVPFRPAPNGVLHRIRRYVADRQSSSESSRPGTPTGESRREEA
jgi:hypothetical protein